MWKIPTVGREFGVCIESTFDRLTRSFMVDDGDALFDGGSVFAGAVRYIDPDAEELPNSGNGQYGSKHVRHGHVEA